MSDRNAWMPLYVGDYLADTMHLTGPEHGAYLLLLMHAWRCGPLPEDERKLAAIARTDLKAWREISDTILAFFTMTDDGLIQGRLERIRVEQGAKIEQRRAAGKASAEARKAQRNGNERSTAVASDGEAGSQKSAETDRNGRFDLSETNEGSSPDKSLKSHNQGSTSVEVSLAPRATEPEPESEKKEKNPPTPQRGAVVRLALPEWLPPGSWADWVKYRRSQKGWTDKAAELSLRELGKLRAAGHDPVRVIEQSIVNGWKGLFPLKGDQAGRYAPREALHETIADILRDPMGCGAAPAPSFDFEGEADHG